MSLRAGLIFVHGFMSSPAVWSRFLRLIAADPALAELTVATFRYRAPAVSMHPLRRIPSLDDAADSLRTFLAVEFADCPRLALVSHSQGGLVVQRLLAQALARGQDREIAKIRLASMYACPHAGSDLALPLRRLAWFWRNRQERELRPLRATVTETQQIVLNRVVHSDQNPIRIMVYAGESDAVVPPASARSVFPHAGTLPGDHFSIIQPDSHSHRSYTVLRRDLLAALAEPEPEPELGPAGPVPRQRAAPDDAPDETPGDAPDNEAPDEAPDGAAPVARPAPVAPLTPAQYERVVNRLLEVPGMAEPSLRQQLYRLLPAPLREQLPRGSIARTELMAVMTTIEDYRHLGGWDALATGVRSLVPDHPAVDEFIATLVELGLVDPPTRPGE